MSPSMCWRHHAADLPLSIYEGFFREHAYGLSGQSFPSWLGDFAISFAVNWFPP